MRFASVTVLTSSVWSLSRARHRWMDSHASRRHVSRNVLSSETFSIEILVSLTAFSLMSAAFLFSVTDVSSNEICFVSFSIFP